MKELALSTCNPVCPLGHAELNQLGRSSPSRLRAGERRQTEEDTLSPLSTDWAAASRARGIRNPEQLT